MKNLFSPVLTGFCSLTLLLVACQPKIDNAGLKKEVLALHDTVMAEDGKAMGQKMVIDSLASALPAKYGSVKPLSDSLGKLSEQMMTWMHQFDPEQGEKTDEQMSAYLKDQKKQLVNLDSAYKSLLKSSGRVTGGMHPAEQPMKGMKM